MSAVLRFLLLAALAVGTTMLSLRLLGGRRGWVTGLVAAVIGWGMAVLVALGVNDWEWGSDSLAIHLVAIGIPATMAAAVILDLLARPGSLAFGERAGLSSLPVRFGRSADGSPCCAATANSSGSAASRGSDRSCRPRIGPSARVDAPGVRLRRVLEQAGGVYVKLGQIAATRVDLLPPDICNELAELQNRVPAEPQERIAAVLEEELGAAVDEVFAEFDWEPLAAASIGQTYRARLRSGESVVVKVQRPDIEAMMDRDLAALTLLANMAQRRTPFGQGVRSGDLLAQFATGLRKEVDFRHEADAMSEMAALLGDRSTVRVPAVHRDLSTRRVLVQERFEGVTVSDIGRLDEADVDRHRLADELLRATLDQIIRIGVFHADPHPGNVFVLAGGELGLIDFGAVGRLDPIEQAAIVDIMIALARRDVSLLRDGVERVAQFTDTTSPDELERALARLMADHVRPGASVDPAVFDELVATLSRFGMRLPTDVVLLSRALVTVDGTLRVLVPDLAFVAAAMRLVERKDDDRPIVDRKELVGQELLAMLPHLRRLPDQVDRILTLTGRGELRVRGILDEDSGRIVRTLANRLLLVLAGTSFLITSAWLLAATDDGPQLAGQTGLFEAFGFGGLLVGAVLVLRVVAAVARDGTT